MSESKLKSKKIRATIWTAALAAAAGGVFAGFAVAAPGATTQVTAPYAQASGLINADGTLDRAKGIKSVTRGSIAGRFCVQLTDSRLDVSELTPVATLAMGGYPGQIYVDSAPAAQCGNQKDTILVVTTNWDKGGDYKPFYLLVP
ncbi:hypothetical protein ACFY94_17425 [Streptomyces griseorubiginosus]|uniref:hypothetical protein n=1 Tax=Streptomyces griseorubiginosus TaxID=67304 RepID=UPI0036F0A13D